MLLTSYPDALLLLSYSFLVCKSQIVDHFFNVLLVTISGSSLLLRELGSPYQRAECWFKAFSQNEFAPLFTLMVAHFVIHIDRFCK
jgi:hypothetical protein